MRKYSACFAVLALASLLGGATNQPRGLQLDDYYRLASVADPHLTPDGKMVAYVVSKIDHGKNRKSSAIWITAADGSGTPRQLTFQSSSTHPRWSPDGSVLAFISSRAVGDATPRAQVWALSMQGGEARQMTNLKDGVSDFVWSPDGKRLAVVGRSTPAGVAKEPGDERVYRNPWYKVDGSGFLDNRRSHISTVDVASGSATQITSGENRDDNEPRWSPDGSHIVFVGLRLDAANGMGQDIWTVPAAGGELLKISDRTQRVGKPAWSPDGRSIAYITSDENEVPKIFVAPAGGGKSYFAAPNFTYPEELDWAPDGKSILAVAPWHGNMRLFRVDLHTHESSLLTKGDRSVTAFDFSEHTGRAVFVDSDATHSGDIYTANLDSNGERPLTHVNADLWGEVETQPMERVAFHGADGWPIEGFLIEPLGRQPGKKYPMILAVHGGPNGMFSMTWSHEFQVFAAGGYAVFFTNPRGSSGYGEAFQRGVAKEWGGKAFTDIMNGVDEVVRTHPWIDGSRLAVRGQSYGGFMTNWIVSHSDRFRAAATLSGISDFISDEGVRDAYYGHAYDFGGNLLENFDLYWNQSPLKYARNVHTPVLILHGDADQRVPLSQGEEWFRALRFYGKTAELVVYPREPHSLRVEPDHAVSVTRRQLEWFDRYLKN